MHSRDGGSRYDRQETTTDNTENQRWNKISKWLLNQKMPPRSETTTLNDQIPYNKEGAESSSSKEGIPSRTGPVSALLELLVTPVDALGGFERLGHKLVNMSRLSREIADQHVL